jgi:tRNA threonylcarbamoyladenosine modification (KEOPS) complex  Pcc1 subunit
MISAAQWQAIDFQRFEAFALAHVKTVYPDVEWKPTRLVLDGGRDANGRARNVATGVEEIYWMEAKHHPRKRSIGPYTLDTHLVSVVSAGGVKRLHVVTSSRLSGGFLLRADSFAKEHGFIFSFSDAATLTSWLQLHPTHIGFFGPEADSVKRALSTPNRLRGGVSTIQAASFILPEDDAPNTPEAPVERLQPGQKYLLVLSFSSVSASPSPVRVRWTPDVSQVSILVKDIADEGIVIEDVTATPLVRVPFRMLRYGKAPITSPSLEIDGYRRSVLLRPPRVLPKLVSPFVGAQAESLLARYKHILVTDVLESRPRLMAFVGRAGSGKSRLAEELRDDAQRLGCAVRMVRFGADAEKQQEKWRSLFRWLFGLENNLFEFEERDLLQHRLGRIDGGANTGDLSAALASFLIDGTYTDDLFNRDLAVGRRLADALVLRLRGPEPLLLHIDDAHHLSEKQMAPLFTLRHIVESYDTLPFCVVVTSRNDETVVERAIDHFTGSIGISDLRRVTVDTVHDFSPPDARELLAKTLAWPELELPESEVASRIIERAGLNAFSLVQTVEFIAVDRQAVAFGHGASNLLVDVAAFKSALADTPRGVDKILSDRFRGLLKLEHGSDLMNLLVTAALLGREAELRHVSTAMERPVSASDLEQLVTRGYLQSFSDKQLLLSHDLLVEALLRQDMTTDVATRFASKAVRSRNLRSIGDERLAAIFFHANTSYASRSWDAIVRVIKHADATEDYRRVLQILTLLEKLMRKSPDAYVVSHELAFTIAGAHQHCGNTATALASFVKLVESARSRLGIGRNAAKEFAACAVEAANQSYLRADVASGLQYIEQAVDVLEDEEYSFPACERKEVLCLAHNRHGALLHLAGEDTEAEAQYGLALQLAKEAGDLYLVCHTYSDLAAILRFRDLAACSRMLAESRRLWEEHLTDKERRRMMIDCSTRYTESLLRNTHSTRGKLLALATEAFERGYLFQAADAFLCHAYAAAVADEWQEALTASVRVLNVTALSEDFRARLYAHHYASVANAALGNSASALDHQMGARRLAGKLHFGHAPLLAVLQSNQEALENGQFNALVAKPFDLV